MVYQNGKLVIKKYWQLNYSEISKPVGYYAKRLIRELEESVRLRMISDVPLGVFLSGGIDSSAVTAMMSKLSDNVKTFSIGFEEQSHNELDSARIIAEKFNTDHKEFIVKPDAVKILPELVWYYNEPFADSSALPTYYVSKLTRKYVKVALNGDGGDESFAGYTRYSQNKFLNSYSHIPSFVRNNFKKIIKRLPQSSNNPIENLFRKTNIAIDWFSQDKIQRYTNYMTLFKKSHFKVICKSNFDVTSTESLLKDYLNQNPSLSFINQMMCADINFYLPNDLLVKIDIASMANSLEARSPFLDHKLMEFAATIPSNLKLKGFTKKYILKKALRKTLPKEILYKKKQGFSVPLDNWFKNELKSISYNILLGKDSISSHYLKKQGIKKLLDSHSLGINHQGRIWSLIWFELWHKIYIENDAKPGAFKKIIL
jgi:asparagine synthase (glutamine-hydrolysing)